MSLFVVAIGLLGLAGLPAWITLPAVLLAPPFHIYRQLKGAYVLGRFGALWRTAVLLWFITFIIVIFSSLLLYMGVAD